MRHSWNRATENLYSAWLELLFDAPVGQELTWPAMDKVVRDRSRNFLFDYLGLHEDNIAMRPDCADFPYFLRTYFSFKLGLPFGYSACSRGFGGHPPRCPGWTNILEAAHSQGLVSSFRQYLQAVADGVQTGNGRTLASDSKSDFYPVPLTQETLRPGTIYADPYGHFLTLVRRVPQSGSAAGVFLAVDAEPDGTITRKRFWRGNFLFVNDPKLGSPGFKRFRPIVRERNGRLGRLSNSEIAKDKQYGDFSLEQSKLSVEAFYDKMDDVMSPAPLDPLLAMKSAITSLEEQVQTRVVAVENGRKYQNTHHGEVEHAGRRGDLRDHRPVGGFLHAGARFPAFDRDRRRAQLSGSRGAAREPLRHAGGQERGGGEGRITARARRGAGGAQVLLQAQRRLVVDADAQGRPRPVEGIGDVVQPERLRRVALGRGRQEQGGLDLPAACAGLATRQDE